MQTQIQDSELSLLSCYNIKKEFIIERKVFFGKPRKTVTAVNDVSFYINEGETLGIVGESGSGKSTMGEILGDLQSPTDGKVFYKNNDIIKMDKSNYNEYRRNVQFIFQDPKGSMNPYHKIGDIIEEPLLTLCISDNREENKKRVKDIIKKVGLETCTISKYPSELSGGQCQRVAIARALIVNPELIICDEPVSALDVSIQAQILNLLKDLQSELKISYIFISHDIGVVNYMADRIAVMKKGCVVETGNAENIFKFPKDLYTNKLVESSFVN